jgi:hypothetical protein
MVFHLIGIFSLNEIIGAQKNLIIVLNHYLIVIYYFQEEIQLVQLLFMLRIL